MSKLHDEILQQPHMLRTLLLEEAGAVTRVANAIREYAPRFAMFVARGSSDNAARYGQYLFGARNRLPVALATPSLFTLYQQPPQVENALVLAISQSGQSPDIVTVIEQSRLQGALTIAITNDGTSPLAQAAEYTLALHAGQEQAVAATKTYTNSLMTLAMLSSALTGEIDSDLLSNVPGWMAAVTDNADAIFRSAERYTYIDYCVVASRGYNYATAFEIALKLKELTYVIAEPYSSADFEHGPLALVERGFPVLAVVPEGALAAELNDFLRKLAERGADLSVISGDAEALALAQTPLPLPASMPEWLSPIVAVMPGQLFALGLTLAKRLDADQPRGIRKVTLTT